MGFGPFRPNLGCLQEGHKVMHGLDGPFGSQLPGLCLVVQACQFGVERGVTIPVVGQKTNERRVNLIEGLRGAPKHREYTRVPGFGKDLRLLIAV